MSGAAAPSEPTLGAAETVAAVLARRGIDSALIGAVALAAHLYPRSTEAGGLKSKSDVLELLSRNPGIDLDGLRARCRQLRLDRRLEAWLRELRSSADD